MSDKGMEECYPFVWFGMWTCVCICVRVSVSRIPLSHNDEGTSTNLLAFSPPDIAAEDEVAASEESKFLSSWIPWRSPWSPPEPDDGVFLFPAIEFSDDSLDDVGSPVDVAPPLPPVDDVLDLVASSRWWLVDPPPLLGAWSSAQRRPKRMKMGIQQIERRDLTAIVVSQAILADTLQRHALLWDQAIKKKAASRFLWSITFGLLWNKTSQISVELVERQRWSEFTFQLVQIRIARLSIF